MITFNAPPPLRALLARITEQLAHRAGEAYVVGGTVRDVLLRRATRDVDLAVAGDALTIARGLADALGGHFVELDAERSVARVVLAGEDERDEYAQVDLAQLQRSVEDDMRRRDFTINALAVPIAEATRETPATIIDPCGGLRDLERRELRMNGAHVFEDDPLRTLRGARIASELGFSVEAETRAAIRAAAGNVLTAAAERRRDELARIFALPDAYGGLRLLDDLALLDVLLPEVAVGKDVTQPGAFHAYDVFEHNMHTVEAMDVMLAPAPPEEARARWMWEELWGVFGWCESELRAYFAEQLSEGRTRAALLKLAALLHDVAKPQTRELHDGGARFFGHADAGGRLAEVILGRYRFAAKETRFVSLMVAEHLRPVQLAQPGEVPTRRALYRLYRDLGNDVPAVLFLSLADAASARGPGLTAEGWRRHARYMNSLIVRSQEHGDIVQPQRLLTGTDIMSLLEIPKGPLIGELLRALEEAQGAGEVNDVEAARAFVIGAMKQESGERRP